MTNLEEILEFSDNTRIVRHRTTTGRLNSILSTGIIVRPYEGVRYTFEGIDSITDLERSGYLAAQEKGEGNTIDTYLQIPVDILNKYDANFDDLRMNYSEYMNFLINYLYELTEEEKPAFEWAETLLFMLKDEIESSNNIRVNKSNSPFTESNESYLSYKKAKESLSGNALKSIDALERFVTGSSYVPLGITIIPAVFIKCYGDNSDGYQLNESYYENLPNQDRVIEGIIDHLVTNRNKVEQETSGMKL